MRIRALAVIACLAMFSAACGDDGETTTDTTDGTTTTTSDESTPSTSSTSDTTVPDADTIDASVYFIDDGQIRVGWERDVVTPAVAEGVLTSLLDGVTADDTGLGLHSEVPDGTTLNSVTIEDDGTGVVDLSAEFAAGGDEASAAGRLAQVVYAMTQFPTVERVEILVDGEPLTSVGDAGLAVDGALTRVDFQFGGTYEGIEGNILVELPRPGAVVEGTSVDVGGSANTFEATVNLEGVDTGGTVLVPEEFTTATSGSGTPGTFYTTLNFPDGTTGEVIVQVFENSAEDGSRRSLTAVPIILE